MKAQCLYLSFPGYPFSYGYIALPSLSRLDICPCLFLDTHLHFGVHCTSQSFQSWYPYNTIQLYCLCVEKFAAYFAWIPFRMSGFIALLIVNTHSHLCVCCTSQSIEFQSSSSAGCLWATMCMLLSHCLCLTQTRRPPRSVIVVVEPTLWNDQRMDIAVKYSVFYSLSRWDNMWENSWDSEFTQSFLVLYCVGEHQTEWIIQSFSVFCSVGEYQTEWNIQSFSVLFCGRTSDRVKYSVFFSPILWENIRQSEILSLFQSYSVGEYQTEWNTQSFSVLFCERTSDRVKYSNVFRPILWDNLWKDIRDSKIFTSWCFCCCLLQAVFCTHTLVVLPVVACFKLCSVPTPWLCCQLLPASSCVLYPHPGCVASCCMFQTIIPNLCCCMI